MSAMTEAPFLARLERFGVVGSTNDVVRDWLASGVAEVCVAVADEQSAGRGRSGRTWTAPPGAGLLTSIGFRPAWLAPKAAWRLAAAVSLAMAEAAEDLIGAPGGSIRLKWPNDLVVDDRGSVRKLGGVLGETDGLGGAAPRAVIGIGVNVGWAEVDFPADLRSTMTSLGEIAGRPIDRELLLGGFLERLESHVEALRAERFALLAWSERQATTGLDVTLAWPDGEQQIRRALGVDEATGALVVADVDHGHRLVLTGEVVHVRLPGAA